MSIYDSLNPEQLSAVKHDRGPLLILAGAGSGKTRVLTHRIAYLIDECDVNPWNILAITFTNKAAKEMKERVLKLIGSEGNSIQISTFHSLGLRLLKENYSKLGYKSNFVILYSITLFLSILSGKNIEDVYFYQERDAFRKTSLLCLYVLIKLSPSLNYSERAIKFILFSRIIYNTHKYRCSCTV